MNLEPMLLVRHSHEKGFAWPKGKTDDGARTVWGHGGMLAVVCTRDPIKRDGFVRLLNGPCANVGNTMSTIENRAFRVLDEQ